MMYMKKNVLVLVVAASLVGVSGCTAIETIKETVASGMEKVGGSGILSSIPPELVGGATGAALCYLGGKHLTKLSDQQTKALSIACGVLVAAATHEQKKRRETAKSEEEYFKQETALLSERADQLQIENKELSQEIAQLSGDVDGLVAKKSKSDDDIAAAKELKVQLAEKDSALDKQIKAAKQQQIELSELKRERELAGDSNVVSLTKKVNATIDGIAELESVQASLESDQELLGAFI